MPCPGRSWVPACWSLDRRFRQDRRDWQVGWVRMAEALRPGDPRRAGPYELLGRLGGGGMGQVYLGRSPGGRPVAVSIYRLISRMEVWGT